MASRELPQDWSDLIQWREHFHLKKPNKIRHDLRCWSRKNILRKFQPSRHLFKSSQAYHWRSMPDPWRHRAVWVHTSDRSCTSVFQRNLVDFPHQQSLEYRHLWQFWRPLCGRSAKYGKSSILSRKQRLLYLFYMFLKISNTAFTAVCFD